MEIRQEFRDYLHCLGFNDESINRAWEIANTTIYKNQMLTLEILTRDLLTNPKRTEHIIKEYIE